MRSLSLAAIAIVGISAATVAIAKDAQQESDKVVCKRQYDADTGSHFADSKKVCHTKSEWRAMEDGAEQSLRNVRDHGGLDPNNRAPGGPGGGAGGPH